MQGVANIRIAQASRYAAATGQRGGAADLDDVGGANIGRGYRGSGNGAGNAEPRGADDPGYVQLGAAADCDANAYGVGRQVAKACYILPAARAANEVEGTAGSIKR